MKKIILIFILLFGLRMFDLIIFSPETLNIFITLSTIILIFSIVLNKRKIIIKQHFKKFIFIFYIGLIINFFVMFFINKLSLYDTLFSTLNYYGFLLYFFLHKYKISKEFLIKLIFIFAGIVASLMLLQQIFSDIPFFNQLIKHQTFMGDRGTIRARIPGMAFVVLSCFILFHNLLLKIKLRTIIIFVFFLFMIFAQGFRSILIAMVLCLFYVYLKGNKNNMFSFKQIYFLLLLGLAVFFAFQIEYISNLFNGIFESVERDQNSLDENIRLETWSYYMIMIKTNYWMYFTGNGLKLAFETPENLFAVDLGIFGFYTMAGIIPSLTLLWMFIKGFFIKIDKKYLFITTFFLYVIVNGFLFNAEAFRFGIFMIYSILFYIIDVNKSEQIEAVSKT